MSLRIISNGYGEDAIACRLIQAYGKDNVSVFPLVGNGDAYRKLSLIPKITQAELPSGGFLLKIKDLFKDLKSGLFKQLRHQRRALLNHPASLQWVIGDVFALGMATWRQNIPTIFFPTAKSERCIPHFKAELAFIKANTQLVFPRDIETHKRMQTSGIQSQFLGNPMFDNLNSDATQPETLTIGLLPGSRYEALTNLKQILTILPLIHTGQPIQFICALSKRTLHTDIQKILTDTPWRLEQNTLHFSQKPLSIPISYNFHDVLQQASLIIGLAGTANEQAMFAKRPVISFIGTGPQSSHQRFIEQKQLIEGATQYVIPSKNPTVIAKKISKILNTETFQWTPLSDYTQHVSLDIVTFIQSQFSSLHP